MKQVVGLAEALTNLNETGNVHLAHTSWYFRVITFVMEKEISTMYSECAFVAFIIQHAKRLRHIDISGSLALPHFSTLCDERHDFRGKIKKNLLNMKLGFHFLYNVCLQHFSFEETFSEMRS